MNQDPSQMHPQNAQAAQPSQNVAAPQSAQPTRPAQSIQSAQPAQPAQAARPVQPSQPPRQQMPPMRPQQTPLSASQPPQKKSKRGPAFWIAITVALIAVCGCVFFGVQSVMGGDMKGMRDPNMSAGQLEGKTEEEIVAELNRMVEEGMFNISIASTIEMENGADEADVQIENVPGNRYLMQVTVVRDDNGEEIYKTGIIEPNYHIQSAKLDTVLPQGVYDCTATFKALDPETEEEVGQASAKLTIYVKS